MRYSLTKTLILLFFLAYFATSFASEAIAEREIYPFFNWSLFAKVPQETQTEFRIRIHSIGEKEFDPPAFFTRIRSQVVVPSDPRPLARDRNYMKLMGRALENENETALKRLREEFERVFVSAPIEYEIVRIQYNIFERWNNGFQPDTIAAEPVRQFTTYATTTNRK